MHPKRFPLGSQNRGSNHSAHRNNQSVSSLKPPAVADGDDFMDDMDDSLFEDIDVDQIMSQLENQRVNKRAQIYLRDLRRDAIIEYN